MDERFITDYGQEIADWLDFCCLRKLMTNITDQERLAHILAADVVAGGQHLMYVTDMLPVTALEVIYLTEGNTMILKYRTKGSIYFAELDLFFDVGEIMYLHFRKGFVTLPFKISHNGL